MNSHFEYSPTDFRPVMLESFSPLRSCTIGRPFISYSISHDISHRLTDVWYIFIDNMDYKSTMRVSHTVVVSNVGLVP